MWGESLPLDSPLRWGLSQLPLGSPLTGSNVPTRVQYPKQIIPNEMYNYKYTDTYIKSETEFNITSFFMKWKWWKSYHAKWLNRFHILWNGNHYYICELIGCKRKSQKEDQWFSFLLFRKKFCQMHYICYISMETWHVIITIKFNDCFELTKVGKSWQLSIELKQTSSYRCLITCNLSSINQHNVFVIFHLVKANLFVMT